MKKEEYKKMEKLENLHFWFLAKRVYFDSLVEPFGFKKLNILDLGCGTGGTTKHLEKYGEVIGLEKDSYARSLCLKKEIKVKKGDVQNIPFKESQFDLVTIFDVLYHKNVKSVNNVLLEAKKVLKKRGYLVIFDSAFEFLKSSHDEVLFGKRRFRVGYLKKLLENDGFVVIRATYLYFFLFFPTIVVRLIVNKATNKKTSEVKKLSEIVNKTLYSIAKLEAKIVKYIDLPFGTSVAIIAQKK